MSGNFLIDCGIVLIYIGFTWLLRLIFVCIDDLKEYESIIESIQYRVH